MASTGFGSILPQRVGTIDTYVYELSKELCRWDLVDLFGRGKGYGEEGNLHIHAFSYHLPNFSKYDRIREPILSSFFNKNLVANVKKLHKNNPIKILHINTVYASIAAKMLKTLLNVQTVCSIHNTFQTPLLIESCDKILASSHYMKRFLIEERGLKREKIDVLPIAVDINRFKPNESAKKELELEDRDVILFIGRKCPDKGPQVLIDALPQIRSKYPKSLALFIGPNYFFGGNSESYSSFLEERSINLGVKDNVLIKGFVSEKALRVYLNAADVVVCPSIWQEPFGKVVIEAYACEKPVVATNVGGLPELVQDGASGIIVPPEDPSALSNAVCTLLEDKKEAKRMAKKGRRIVEEKFSYEVVSAKCQEIYEKLITETLQKRER